MLTVTEQKFRLKETFTIARGSRDTAHVITVQVNKDGVTGWGEAVPYGRYGETMQSVRAQIESLPPDITRTTLADRLPPGAARNAVDCALWDVAAKVAAKPAWQLAGVPRPGPVITAFTLSLDTPDRMRAAAARHAHRPLLKIKLGGEDDMARLEAVRSGAPDTAIIVDANEAWTAPLYTELAPHLIRLGVEMVEQPLPAGKDDMLAQMARPRRAIRLWSAAWSARPLRWRLRFWWRRAHRWSIWMVRFCWPKTGTRLFFMMPRACIRALPRFGARRHARADHYNFSFRIPETQWGLGCA